MNKLTVGFSLAFLAVACSSSDSSATAGGPGTQAYAQALCTHTQKCAPNDFAAEYADMNGCNALFQQEIAFELTLPGISATESQLKACADAYSTLDCNGDSDTLPACNIAGTLATGGVCQSSSQCQSNYCKFTTDSSANAAAVDCGTCQPKSAANGPCTEDDGCSTGLVCASGTSTCVTAIAKGAACTPGTNCATGLVCVGGVCGDPVAVGGKCDQSESSCVDDSFCQNNVCTSFDALVTVVELGQPCSVDANTGKQIACKKSSCVGAAGAEKCVANAQIGQPCATSFSSTSSGSSQDLPNCDGFAICQNGTCVKPDPNQCK